MLKLKKERKKERERERERYVNPSTDRGITFSEWKSVGLEPTIKMMYHT